MSSDYFIVLGIVGVAFFAVSGALLGHDKNINGFGIVVVGVMTALGGGTLRDLLLGKPIFWVETAYTGAIRTSIPALSGHPFRFNPDTDSGISQPVFC